MQYFFAKNFFAAGGIAATDALLARAARRRSARIAEEFPTVVEFLALSVAAGESILEALRRVARTGSGELAGELDRVVQRAAAGQPHRALGLQPRRRSLDELRAENERLREELASAYVDQSGAVQHASDCATSNAPAMKPGPCDCAALG